MTINAKFHLAGSDSTCLDAILALPIRQQTDIMPLIFVILESKAKNGLFSFQHLRGSQFPILPRKPSC